MPRRAVKFDFGHSTVSNSGVSIAPTATSIPVADGSQFPDTANGKFTIRFPTSGEVCRVNTRVGNVFTSVTRGLPEGALGTYSGTTILDNAEVDEIWGAQDIADSEDYIPPLDASNITTGTLAPAHLPLATTGAFGAVKPDGSTITVSGGVISSTGGGGGGSGTVTSVGLSLPGDFIVSGSPVTGSGTLTATRNVQSANAVFAGPATGSPASPTYRALVQADIPALDASQLTTGALAKARQNANTAYTDVATAFAVEVTVPDLKVTGLTGSVQAMRMVGATASGAPLTGPHLVGDVALSLADGKYYVCTVAGTPGTFVSAAGSGTVTSVGLTVPTALLSVSGSPITSSGTLAVSLATQSANTVLAGPTTGSPATPTMRSLVAADLPPSSAVLSTANVSNPPTDAELQSALGTPAAVGRQLSEINDAGNSRNEYATLSDGAAFWSALLTKARLASSTATATNATSALTTPTYDGSGQTVEPMVLYSPDKWPTTGNNYHYWMAVAPYPASNNAFENPSLLVSDDGTTWSVPTGLTNPLVAAPGTGNNADPWIMVDASGTMWYYFNQDGASSDLVKVMSSTDGVTWSAPATILTGGSSHSVGSPVVVWDGTQYVMYTCNANAFPYFLERRTCSTPNGTWSSATTLTVTGLPTGYAPEDMAVYKRGATWQMFVVLYNNGASAGSYKLHFAESTDGLTWTCATTPLLSPSASAWDDFYTYRGSGVPTPTGYDFWYSGRDASNVWHVGRTSVSLTNLTLEQLTRVAQVRDTATNIINFGGTLEETALAFATDTGRFGLYSGGRWNWSASVTDLTSITGLTNSNISPTAAIALSKIGQSGATADQVPTWNGSAYVPADVAGGDHLHGLARWAAGGGTVFDLPDIAEYVEMVYDNGTAVDATTVTLSADRTQLLFDVAPTTGHVLQIDYVIARM